MKMSFKQLLGPVYFQLERQGHQIHVKNVHVDRQGQTRYYITLLKKAGKRPYNAEKVKKLVESAANVLVEIGRGHPVATVLEDGIVQRLPRAADYHCQRMTVIA